MTRREWLSAFVLLQGICIALAFACGRDLNWDQFNYHLFAGMSVFQDRLGQDFFPASIQTYLNPLMYGPFYWMVRHDFHSFAISAVHAAVHALNPLLLYAIARQVMPAQERYKKTMAAVAVALGCASAVFISELGTTFMDLTTAVPVLAAAWLLSKRSQTASAAWLAGTLLGIAVGLKLTNIAFAAAAALATLVLCGGSHQRIAAALRLGAAMAIGFLVSYGVWGWKLYLEFGSPLFPYFNGIFKAAEYGPTSMQFVRFIPFSMQDWLLFPLRMAELKSWVYTETVAPDIRPIAVIAAAFAAGFAVVWKRSRPYAQIDVGRAPPDTRRGQQWLGLFTLLSSLLWMATSANGRYGLVWLMLLGPLALVLFHAVARPGIARVMLLVLLFVQTFHMASPGNSRWNPQHWSDTWFEERIPERLRTEPYLHLTLGSLSNSYVAAFMHPQSAFINLVGQHSLAFDRPGGERLRKILGGHMGRIRVLAPWTDQLGPPDADSLPAKKLDAILDYVMLQVDFSDCLIVSSDGAGLLTALPNMLPETSVPGADDDKSRKVMLSCLLKPRTAHDPSQEARRQQLEPIYKAFEARCPRLFRPAGAVPVIGRSVVSAYYMETGISLNVVQNEITYYAERQPVDTFIGRVDSVEKALEGFDCRRPRNGSREF